MLFQKHHLDVVLILSNVSENVCFFPVENPIMIKANIRHSARDQLITTKRNKIDYGRRIGMKKGKEREENGKTNCNEKIGLEISPKELRCTCETS